MCQRLCNSWLSAILVSVVQNLTAQMVAGKRLIFAGERYCAAKRSLSTLRTCDHDIVSFATTPQAATGVGRRLHALHVVPRAQSDRVGTHAAPAANRPHA